MNNLERKFKYAQKSSFAYDYDGIDYTDVDKELWGNLAIEGYKFLGCGGANFCLVNANEDEVISVPMVSVNGVTDRLVMWKASQLEPNNPHLSKLEMLFDGMAFRAPFYETSSPEWVNCLSALAISGSLLTLRHDHEIFSNFAPSSLRMAGLAIGNAARMLGAENDFAWDFMEENFRVDENGNIILLDPICPNGLRS